MRLPSNLALAVDSGLALLGLALTAACAPPAPPEDRLAAIERRFDSARYLQDQIRITRARGVDTNAQGIALPELERSASGAWAAVGAGLDSLAGLDFDPVDRVVLATLRERVAAATTGPSPAPAEPSLGCDRPATPTARETVESLTDRVYRCYGRAAERIVVRGDTLDRLTILGLLGRTESARRREALFRALAPVWRSVNGDDGPTSPYRRLVELRREAWKATGSPIDDRARRFGLEPEEATAWLIRGLEAWRATLPDTLFEPWDYYHFVGAASRRLADRLPLDSLPALNQRFYADLGASPAALGIRYDLAPRRGKTPVAFTDFGARALSWSDGSTRSEPWVFASYRIGGFDNLLELLHETGHAVHIAAIRARPAYHDWPDADLFTEGVADLATQDAYEPGWQRRYLGDSVPLGVSIRGKYGSVMLDFAWSLFEIEVHRPGAPSPNAVWDGIVGRFLAIRPHPELSWWAMRGQLIESPGYMGNYALGAFVVADLRRAVADSLAGGGMSRWYRVVSDGLFRFGSTLPARQVTERFLGRPPAPEALLADLGRIRRSGRRRRGRGPRCRQLVADRAVLGDFDALAIFARQLAGPDLGEPVGAHPKAEEVPPIAHAQGSPRT